MMLWIAIIHLASFAIMTELVARAPELPWHDYGLLALDPVESCCEAENAHKG